MTTSNPHLRAIVLVGVLSLIGAALAFYTLNRQNQAGTGPVAVTSTVTAHPATATPAPAKAKAKPAVAKAKPATAKTTPAATKPAATRRASTPSDPPVVRAALAYGLPKAVATQFAHHGDVVVSVYSSLSQLDGTAEAEAKAGAALAGAGFAAIDVSREGGSGALTKLLGIVAPPATLIFQRPAADAIAAFAAAAAAPTVRGLDRARTGPTPPQFTLAVQFAGFTDRDMIAQAARDADPEPNGPVRPTTWATKANALCTSAQTQLAAAGTPKTKAQLRKALPLFRSTARSYLAGLAKLTPPAGHEDAVSRFVDLQRQDVTLTEQYSKAVIVGDAVAAASLQLQETNVARAGNTLAFSLGATACANGL